MGVDVDVDADVGGQESDREMESDRESRYCVYWSSELQVHSSSSSLSSAAGGTVGIKCVRVCGIPIHPSVRPCRIQYGYPQPSRRPRGAPTNHTGVNGCWDHPGLRCVG